MAGQREQSRNGAGLQNDKAAILQRPLDVLRAGEHPLDVAEELGQGEGLVV